MADISLVFGSVGIFGNRISVCSGAVYAADGFQGN